MVFELDKMPYQTVQGPDPYKKLMAIKQKKQQVCQELSQLDYHTKSTMQLLGCLKIMSWVQEIKYHMISNEKYVEYSLMQTISQTFQIKKIKSEKESLKFR